MAAYLETWEIHLLPNASNKPEALLSSRANFLTLQVVTSLSVVK